MRAVREASEIVVLGGGCYGCFHTGQLLKAADRGRLCCNRLVVVDRNPLAPARTRLRSDLVEVVTADWTQFLVDYAPRAPHDAHLVPAPLAPHVLADWLVLSVERARPDLRLVSGPLPGTVRLPYDHTVGRSRYLSEAAWRCPATCPEPAVCPATKGPRTWDLERSVRLSAEVPVVTFPCRHFVYGVGTIPLVRLRWALRWAEETAAPGWRVGVLTASHCHGVGTALHAVSASLGGREDR